MANDKEGVLSTGSPIALNQHASESSKQSGPGASDGKNPPPPKRVHLGFDPDTVTSQFELPSQVPFKRR